MARWDPNLAGSFVDEKKQRSQQADASRDPRIRPNRIPGQQPKNRKPDSPKEGGPCLDLDPFASGPSPTSTGYDL